MQIKLISNFIFDHLELYITKTGEKTLYLPNMDETYHSRNGALTEATHVFIKECYNRIQKKSEIQIFEVGFGTGLNALVTAIQANVTKQKVYYTSIEPFPVPLDIAQELNYGSLLNAEDVYCQIHKAEWDKKTAVSDYFALHKLQDQLENISLDPNTFDAIYFDAFAPKKQPELWDKSIFQKLFNTLNDGGILTTYSAAGQLKRDLKSIGFDLLHPPGANGKREMTVAIKPLT